MSAGVRLCELSAAGRGAVSVLAVEGAGAAALLERLTGAPAPRAGSFTLVHLCEAGVELDEALLFALAPERFELQITGSPPLLRRLLALADPGAAPAPPNAESRAAALLARAQGESAARMLLDQAEGALRRELAALAEASPARRREALAALAGRARVARRLVEPARVVIAGPANAGKSTLFNALLGEGRALVHEQPGTTRDALSEPAQLGAWPVWLCDTAGERALEPGARGAAVEAEGQRRARRLAEGADLVLWLDPAGGAAPPRARVLRSRAPVAELGRPDTLAALEDPGHARARVAALFRDELGLPEEPWLRGAGVPFDAALAGGLERLDPELGSAAWRRALDELLGPAGRGADCLPGALPLTWGPRTS